MTFAEFIGQVLYRLELPEPKKPARASLTALTALGHRVHEVVATNWASRLALQIDRYLIEGESGQRFENDDFPDPGERACAGQPHAQYHAKQIVAAVSEIDSRRNIEKLRNQRPDGFDTRFECAEP